MAITSMREKYLAEIREYHYAKKGNGAAIARESGIQRGSLGQMLKGKRQHSLEMLIRVSDAVRRLKKRESK